MAEKKYKFANRLINKPIPVLISYMIFQGVLYMTPGERLFKVLVTIIFAVLFYAAGIGLLWSFVAGHFANFFVNSQIPVMLRYLGLARALSMRDVTRIIEKLAETAKAHGIREVLFYGSFCRGKMHSYSDIDIRLYHRSGLLSSARAYCYALKLRLWANINGLPLDVFCFSELNFINKMDDREVPALLFSNDIFKRKFPNAPTPRQALDGNRGLQ
ncbi:hypothetical protein GRI69_04390 [Erythrobacter vulgaris]|uniref:Polymerase nucleotidyl transferase domain-containing protein n=1 Tax=Qipengyuania vulgaris TaxID=291985 RepID=A0A844XQ00_9SPHN|nr:nucleotidyltransferase domain-containing protein [Qipengyuania vulgaris]MXO47494.1 hypothetical protein [Qipengyuania vulgaris]